MVFKVFRNEEEIFEKIKGGLERIKLLLFLVFVKD
jgi:hypothetical protein